jgi:hypothetical protein
LYNSAATPIAAKPPACKSVPVRVEILESRGEESATRPPDANSQIRVGMPKNAHGCAAFVIQSEASNEIAPVAATPTASRFVSPMFARAPSTKRAIKTNRSGQMM